MEFFCEELPARFHAANFSTAWTVCVHYICGGSSLVSCMTHRQVQRLALRLAQRRVVRDVGGWGQAGGGGGRGYGEERRRGRVRHRPLLLPHRAHQEAGHFAHLCGRRPNGQRFEKWEPRLGSVIFATRG